MTTLLLETASQNPALACQFAFILVHLDDPRLLRFVLARLPADAASLRAILSKQFTNDLWSQTAAFTSSYQNFLTRRSHHDNRLLDEYVRFVTYEDTNVQEAMLVANALTSIGSGNEFVMNNGNWVKKAESWTKFGIIASFALVRTDAGVNASRTCTGRRRRRRSCRTTSAATRRRRRAAGSTATPSST